MKCKICNKKFELLKENRYMVTNENLKEVSKIGLSSVFEAFDCPHCGYLNLSVILVNQLGKAPLRYRVFVNNDYSKYIVKDAEGVAIIKEFDNKKELVDWIEVIALWAITK